jgi:outer membrane receptor protein involved in Fe transport
VKTTLHKSALFSATCLTGVAALFASTPALAQATGTPDAGTAAAEDVDANNDASTIVVTGSLIRNPNLEQANPVNVTTSDQIELKQSNVAEEVLRELPGVVPNIGSAVNNGNGGFSYVDLRGLGSNRNIVLLDGNRIVPADLVGRVDLNNIPLALISRVDALTGAAVTTYGADAITGVVNFITKKDFAGLEVAASEQITEEGDGNFFRIDGTIGANFDDGRGNAVLSLGYQDSDPVFQGDRDFSLNQISSFTGGGGGSGTSFPSRFSGTRPLVGGVPSTDPTVANGGVRQVNAAGQAVATFQTFNFNPFNVLQVPFERFNIFAQANYEVSDNIEVYTRGLFSKNTVNTIIAPSGSFGGTVTINLNNPFLPTTLRNQFCAFNTALAGSGVYTPRFTPAECAAAALATGPTDPRYRTVTATLNRRAVENGPRISDYQSTVFDYRVGARGGITDSIDWDVTGAYGESDQIQTIKNYTLQSRFRQGTLVDLVGGVPTCTNTANGCVPVDIFSSTGYSAAAADFLNENSTTATRTSLAQVRGVISGDFGFTMPSADEPIGFALGTEYRKYHAQQASDTLAKTPGELGGAGGAAPDIDGGYDVYEGYGELIAPIFDMLTIEAGARYSHYKVDGGGTNNTFTYKVGGTFEPFDGLKFRGNYAKAVRSPNIFELFNPPNTVLTNLGVDPCAGAAPTTNANLRAVCIAQGAPAGSIGSITNPTAGQANITTAGNINLDPEKAKTYTFGVVWQPDFIPRFSMSADYYHIKVTDVIGAPLPGDLIAACFGNLSAASATDPNCTVIRRGPITGGLDGDAATTPGLFAPLNNLGTLLTDGIDVIANYNTDLGFGRLATSFVGNWTNRSKYKATPDGLNRECVRFYSVNCSFTGSIQPEWQWSLRNTLTVEDIDLSLLWRHIGSVEHEPQDIIDQGAFFSGTLPASTGSLAGRTVDFNKIDSQDYFDLSARFNVSDNLTFTATVQNLLDNQPPIVGNTAGSTTYNSGNTYPSTYDALGRRYAVSAKVKF